MQRSYLGLPLVLLFALASPAQTDNFFWHNNYKQALDEARRTQKPIFLEFRCEP